MKRQQLLISLITGFLLVACGGEEEDSTSSPSLVEYTGLETEATISIANAAGIVREMFGLGGISISLSATAEEETTESKPEPYNILVPLALTETIKDINAGNAIDSALAAKNFSEVRNCETGHLDYIITVDDLTGVFNGNMTYDDCLVAGFTLEGSAEVSGHYDLMTNTFVDISLDFPWLKGKSEVVDYVASERIQVAFADPITTTTLENTVVSIDNRKAVKFEGYAIVVNEDTSEKTLALSGRFYHPDEGFVTVSTDGSIFFTENTNWPYHGQLSMQGTLSVLQIEFQDSEAYTLWVDEGDEDSEWDYVDLVNW
ncbi:MAG: hypothetical protein ABFS39_06325 [Pseudomonadota bacterium]